MEVTLKVRVVKPSNLKDGGWFETNKGKVFDVINKRHGGYDVDMAPCGYPRVSGWLGEEEVEEVVSNEGLAHDIRNRPLGKITITIDGKTYEEPIFGISGQRGYAWSDVLDAVKNGKDPAQALIFLAETGAWAMLKYHPDDEKFVAKRKEFLGK